MSSVPRVTSLNLWVTSSNPRFTSADPRVASSIPRVMSSNLRVTSSNPRVTSSNPRATRFFFHHFNTKRCAVLLNYYCQALSISPYGINGGLSDNSCSSVPFASALSPPWYLAQPNSHIKK